jgi:hypothetical protein
MQVILSTPGREAYRTKSDQAVDFGGRKKTPERGLAVLVEGGVLFPGEELDLAESVSIGVETGTRDGRRLMISLR